MSAARLAAEAIFQDLPSHPAASTPAQVVVRRARLVASASPGQELGEGRSEAKSQDKSPRVFRIAAVPALNSAAPVSSTPPTLAGGPPQRPRRVAADKRPGPVLHVVHALPARQPPVEAAASDLKALINGLARVGPVLQAIERAQAFCVTDDRFAAEWERLSRRADALRLELKAPLRWIDQQVG